MKKPWLEFAKRKTEQGVDVPAVERRVEALYHDAMNAVDDAIEEIPIASGTLSARIYRMQQTLMQVRDILRAGG